MARLRRGGSPRATSKVVIPYAAWLAEAIPPVAVRLRRDFRALLRLIETHAILHQLNRATDECGRIVATEADYLAVRALVADLISDQVGHTVPAATRETVDAIAKLDPGDGVKVHDLEIHFGLERSTVQYRVASAREKGYLVNIEEKRGSWDATGSATLSRKSRSFFSLGCAAPVRLCAQLSATELQSELVCECALTAERDKRAVGCLCAASCSTSSHRYGVHYAGEKRLRVTLETTAAKASCYFAEGRLIVTSFDGDHVRQLAREAAMSTSSATSSAGVGGAPARSARLVRSPASSATSPIRQRRLLLGGQLDYDSH